MTKAVLINGGNSIYSRLTGVQLEIEKHLRQENIDYEIIYVHQLSAQDLLTANFASEEIAEQVKKVEKADLVFFLTPIYKGSFTGILKTFIDLLPQKSLEGKIVIPVAIGGSIAHLLALEYALNPVLSILGATHITNPIYIVDAHVERLEDGGFALVADAQERIERVWATVPKKQYA